MEALNPFTIETCYQYFRVDAYDVYFMETAYGNFHLLDPSLKTVMLA